MRQDRPRPCAHFPVSYAYTAFYLVLPSTNALDGLGLPALVVCSRLERTLVERPYDSRACIPVVARGPGVVWYVRQHSYARFSALPPSIVTNALEGLTGSASRLLFIFGDACEPHSRPIQKAPPGVLCDCLFRREPLTKNTSSAFRSAPSIDHRRASKCISPGAQKKPLNLLPRRRHHGAPGRSEPLAGVRSRSRVRCRSLTHTAQTLSFVHRLATNNSEMEPIVAVHANILSPTGPGLATEPPRHRRVATAPRSALVPNNPRLCRFPGREAGFGAQRGFCRPPII